MLRHYTIRYRILINLPQVLNLREVMDIEGLQQQHALQMGVLFSIEPQFAVDAIPVG
jgi:hypothetical protein